MKKPACSMPVSDGLVLAWQQANAPRCGLFNPADAKSEFSYRRDLLFNASFHLARHPG